MPTAQELFKVMMRDEVGPGLRKLGLRGSGRKYKLPDEEAYRLLSFQGWHYSSSEKLQFTINLALISKLEWETRSKFEYETRGWRWPAAPSSSGYPVGEDLRLGQLMPGGGDRWWTLRASDESRALATELLDAISAYGVPWLRRPPVWRKGNTALPSA